ncbi:MAG: hypothetical protein NTZ39_09720 [Methanoregula sp.]|nr:hypothetical protein [Methanoregula sp.]
MTSADDKDWMPGINDMGVAAPEEQRAPVPDSVCSTVRKKT